MNSLHFILNNCFVYFCFVLFFFFLVSYFVEKKQQQQQNRHGDSFISVSRFFFNLIRPGLVYKSKYKMNQKVYVNSFTYPRSAQCIKTRNFTH